MARAHRATPRHLHRRRRRPPAMPLHASRRKEGKEVRDRSRGAQINAG